jgi:acetyltransferase
VNLQGPLQPEASGLRKGKAPSLDAVFAPRSVAVIGATDREGSVGRATLLNPKNSSFRGKVYPVNSHHSEILGLLFS